MAETPETETQADQPPELPQEAQAGSSRLTMTVVSLAALAIIGAATANFLPSFGGVSLPSFESVSLPSFPKFDRFSLPKFDHFALPNFHRAPPPKSDRVAAVVPPPPAPVFVPDSIVRASLRDVQTTQQQHSAALEQLTQGAETQQADLKRISRQLSSLTAQVNALHSSVAPLTTSSITPSNPRARIIRTSRRAAVAVPAPPAPPALPKPVGPVSVGGAPLNPTPASGSGA
ncbi:MAG: hypothetical protein GY844_21955 [Bradyrhizobium sp.]|nr:hypothetical protein [Bradyrhizobium sp.]